MRYQSPPTGRDDLQYRKEELLSELREIEFDYHMGKLSEEDFKALTREYKLRAAQVLQEIRGAEEMTPRKETPGCPECLARIPEGARFCPQCGTHLGENHA